MSDIQFLAERIARIAERLAILETAQSVMTGQNMVLNVNTTIATDYSLVLESLEVPDDYYIEIASGAALVLVG